VGNVADELVRHGILKDLLPLVETSDWFAALSAASEGTRLKHIVRLLLLPLAPPAHHYPACK
jgi:hypothetical protein